ncbi:MAG: phosphatidylserine decarboxylase [Acidobacteria bacterium ACB1]|nr:Phosphatidylserine decarboxylase proenzyme [Pyrinomonadaceae bacterium]MCE7961903.1 phosphatidylserine decarboxylase [Acidobacteria bacterium ACB1]
MAKEGIPFILVALAIAALFAIFGWWIGVVVFVLIAAFLAYFFRDPERHVPRNPNAILAAADGRVTCITEDAGGTRISVFMSPFDVHINRSPITGTIREIIYSKGRKLPATRNEASYVNERNTLVIEGDGLTVKCTQIAGIMARRIVCRPKIGDKIEQGERFGLIKFSSRTDVLVPSGFEVAVTIGDHVRGGETIIARRIS